MAEVLGLISSIALILTAVDNSVKVVNKVIKLTSASTADSRLETLRWRVRTESWRVEEWANNVTFNQTAIKQDRLDLVDEIRQQLKEASNRVELRLAKFTRGAASSRPVQRLKSRYGWDAGGYDDCKDIADLMRALNEALVTLVPPLPSYPGRSADATGTAPRTSQHIPEPLSSAPSAPTREIENLWQSCSRAMNVLGSQQRTTDAALMSLHLRICIWGAGLLHKSTGNLDALLSADKRAPLRRYILSQFVEIVVVQGACICDHLLSAN